MAKIQRRKLQRLFSNCIGTGALLGLLSLGSCDRSETVSGPLATPAAIQFGTKISFGEGGNSERYKVTGWSKTEAKFTWTEGTSARLQLPISPTNDPISLKMTMAALVNPPDVPFQPVEVFANDQKIADWQVGNTAEFVAALPSAITKVGGVLNLEFKTPKATSPKALGQSADARVLGICCLDLELAKG